MSEGSLARDHPGYHRRAERPPPKRGRRRPTSPSRCGRGRENRCSGQRGRRDRPSSKRGRSQPRPGCRPCSKICPPPARLTRLAKLTTLSRTRERGLGVRAGRAHAPTRPRGVRACCGEKSRALGTPVPHVTPSRLRSVMARVARATPRWAMVRPHAPTRPSELQEEDDRVISNHLEPMPCFPSPPAPSRRARARAVHRGAAPRPRPAPAGPGPQQVPQG
jgi:hypothetical protein